MQRFAKNTDPAVVTSETDFKESFDALLRKDRQAPLDISCQDRITGVCSALTGIP
jgi:hypothetical protein